MIKFTDTQIVFQEIPDEISLGVNISNCTHNCPGCHSPELRQNIGTELDFSAVDRLIEENDGITCFLLLGEGNDEEALKNVILYIKEKYLNLKIGLYSGRENVDEDFYWDKLDYLKIGPYVKEWGPLNCSATNQRLYGVVNINKAIKVHGKWRSHWADITNKFWKNENLY